MFLKIGVGVLVFILLYVLLVIYTSPYVKRGIARKRYIKEEQRNAKIFVSTLLEYLKGPFTVYWIMRHSQYDDDDFGGGCCLLVLALVVIVGSGFLSAILAIVIGLDRILSVKIGALIGIIFCTLIAIYSFASDYRQVVRGEG